MGSAASAVVGATSYNVYRATVSGGPYAPIGTVAAPATAYSDTTIGVGTRYFYVVTAVNGCESVNSNEATASTCTLL